jgi:hypothetical protein
VQVLADTVPPVIVVLGSATVTIQVGSNYTDAGATASDNVDGDLTRSIVVDNPVDTNQVGTYTVTYSVEDQAGNSDVATRTVIVQAAPPPPPPQSSGGGGAASHLALTALALLALCRGGRRKVSFAAIT